MFAQSKRERAAKEFMHDKLELSQRTLEGIALEDYDLIISKGIRPCSLGCGEESSSAPSERNAKHEHARPPLLRMFHKCSVANQ